MTDDKKVIVVGAGAAGMAAAADLSAAGFSVAILEARDRTGGRMFTLRDSVLDVPIELGAEFIHGKPPEIWKVLQKRKVKITEVKGDNWCADSGELQPCDFSSQVDHVLEKMDAQSPDESFLNFLNRCLPNKGKDPKQEEARRRAVDYVSGFNAADPGLVGVHWLVKEREAEEKIEGDRAFRAKNGYADLVEIFAKQLTEGRVSIQTEAVVKQVLWSESSVEVTGSLPDGAFRLTAPRAIVTIPLGVLQMEPGEVGAVEFVPALPARMRDAMKRVEMGKVIRIVLRFRTRFWENIAPAKSKTLSKMSFLFSEDEWFPTWWTTMPERLPIITGWAPFRAAEGLSGQSRDFVVDKALGALHALLHVSREDLGREIEAAYFHDWQSDPYSRGAYSYGKIGAVAAVDELASPVANTLFFAGEATDVSGNNGTVHGAIASGRRAAKEIIDGV
jgi:monoamine oxidase